MIPASTLRDRENALFDRWRQARPELAAEFVADGVVDEAAWHAAPRRVLYLGKDAYDDRGGTEPWDLRTQVASHNVWWQTWNNVSRWHLSLLAFPHELPLDDLAHWTQVEREAACRSLAWVNVKKIQARTAISDMDAVMRYALEDRAYLREQLDLYRPDFTVCCGTFAMLEQILTPKELGPRTLRPDGRVAFTRSPWLGLVVASPHPGWLYRRWRDLHAALLATVRRALA